MTLLPIHPRLSTTRLELHHAAQVVAGASRLIAAQDDDSHTTLRVDGTQLQGRPQDDGRRVTLDVLSLDLRLTGSDEPSSRFELEARRLGDGFAWLSAQLGTEVTALEYNVPARYDAPFIVTKAQAQLLGWLQIGWRLLAAAATEHGGSDIKLWPHHFDIATLISLDKDSGEDSRSINVGLSFGDDAYDEPYWYVTPWPTPKTLPTLTHGRWHTAGFTAAVLPATDCTTDVEADAKKFLSESVAMCRTML